MKFHLTTWRSTHNSVRVKESGRCDLDSLKTSWLIDQLLKFIIQKVASDEKSTFSSAAAAFLKVSGIILAQLP